MAAGGILRRVLDYNLTYASRLHPKAQSLQVWKDEVDNSATCKLIASHSSTTEVLNSKLILKEFLHPPKPWQSSLYLDHRLLCLDSRFSKRALATIESSNVMVASYTFIMHSHSSKDLKRHTSSSHESLPVLPSSTQLSLVCKLLQDEMNHFFENKGFQDIYEKNMTFINNLFSFQITLRSGRTYIASMSMCTLLTRTLYHNLSFDVLKITKNHEAGEINVRWSIQGSPRLIPWSTRRVLLDGFSTFIVNSQGKIQTHKADKMMPSPKEPRSILNLFVQIGLMLGFTPRQGTKLNPQTQNISVVKIQ